MRGEIYLDGRWVMTLAKDAQNIQLSDQRMIRDMRNVAPGMQAEVVQTEVVGKELVRVSVPFWVIRCAKCMPSGRL